MRGLKRAGKGMRGQLGANIDDKGTGSNREKGSFEVRKLGRWEKKK